MGICKIGKKEKTRKSVCRLDLRVRLMVTRTGIEPIFKFYEVKTNATNGVNTSL